MKGSDRDQWWWFLLVVAGATLVLWPLLRPGFFISDDGEWMIIRLTAFFQSLREGQFPVRFLGRLNHNYGYPVANFLYPAFLYIGSLVHALGVPFVESVKIILAGSVAGTALFLFLWLRTYFVSTASFFGVISFLLSPYLLYDFYKRGSVGEILAFLPATAGLYSIAARKKWLLAFSTALLIVSHNSLAFLFLPLFILYIAYRRAREFLVPFFLGVTMAGFFWLPALFERSLVLFDTVRVSDPEQYFVRGDVWWLVGPGSFVALFFSFMIRTVQKKQFFVAVFLASVVLALPASEALWQWHTFAKLFQFPYRFLSVSVLFGAWLAALCFSGRSVAKRAALLVLLVLVWLRFALPVFSNIDYVQREEPYYTTNEGTTTVADEYMPRWVREKPQGRPASKVEFVHGGGTIVPRKALEEIDADITSLADTLVQINTVYYPGWGATVDGKPVAIDYDNPSGLMRVAVSAGTHRLQVQFRETPGRLAADILSFGALVVAVALALTERKRYTKHTR